LFAPLAVGVVIGRTSFATLDDIAALSPCPSLLSHAANDQVASMPYPLPQFKMACTLRKAVRAAIIYG
jgi:hypothetical protein